MLSPWFSCWSGQEPACMERGGKQVLYTKHPCSATLWTVALCSARRVQSPLSIASVKLATGRHSSAHHFYPRENWKMLPSPTLLNGQLKAWEYILTLLKPVAGLPWISAMPILHLLRARRGRALNCNTTEKTLCLLLRKELEIKVESVPNTLSVCCLAKRCSLAQVYVLAWPAWHWGSLDAAQSLGSSCF